MGSRLSHRPASARVASRCRCTSRIGGTRDLTFVLPIEVGGVLVPHARGDSFRVEVFREEQTAGLLQSQLLLELLGGSSP